MHALQYYMYYVCIVCLFHYVFKAAHLVRVNTRLLNSRYSLSWAIDADTLYCLISAAV